MSPSRTADATPLPLSASGATTRRPFPPPVEHEALTTGKREDDRDDDVPDRPEQPELQQWRSATGQQLDDDEDHRREAPIQQPLPEVGVRHHLPPPLERRSVRPLDLRDGRVLRKSEYRPVVDVGGLAARLPRSVLPTDAPETLLDLRLPRAAVADLPGVRYPRLAAPVPEVYRPPWLGEPFRFSLPFVRSRDVAPLPSSSVDLGTSCHRVNVVAGD